MSFRIATLNLARNEKRWDERRELVASEIAALKPDILALNEIWLPLQTGQWLRQHARLADSSYTLVQQAKNDSDQPLEAEGLLSRFEAIAHAHRFYAKKDAVALVTRLEIDGRLVDVYVTHLYAALRPDALRAEQVTELINWTHERDDVPDKILCGDCNSTLESDSMKLLASEFRPTQTLPTAFTPLAEKNGAPSHADWPRMDRCIDFIWVTNSIRIVGSGRCFDRPAEADATLWPSDHVGVWADLELG